MNPFNNLLKFVNIPLFWPSFISLALLLFSGICFKIGQFGHWLWLLPLLYIQIFGVFAFFLFVFFVCVCLQPHSFIKRISTNKRRKKTHMERKQEALLSISAVINIFCGNQFCQLLIKLSMITAVSWIHLSHLFFVGYLFFRNWNLTVIILRKPFLSLRSANK